MRYFFFLFFILQTAEFMWAESGPLSKPSVLFTGVIEAAQGRRDTGFDVLPLKNGAIISGSSSSKEKSVDGLLMHVDEKGEILWRKDYGGTGMDLIFSVLPDGDGFVCVGFKSPGDEINMKAMDGWILRIDSKGELIWEHTYGGPGEDRLTGIRRISDGWMAVGHREIRGKIQAWVLRIDQKGNQINSWSYDSSLPTKGLDVIPLQDGGFVFVGGEGTERETSDGFVIRIDANGRQLWKHLIAGPGFQVGYHIQSFSDNSFLVIGYGGTENKKDHEAYVLRIGVDGKVLYHRNFGGPTHDRATNALILQNDSVVVVGQTQRPGSKDEDSGWDMIIYALNSKGEEVWSGRFGGDGVEFGRAVKGQPQNLWIIGHTTSQDGSNALMIRLDVTGVS
jgi:hypothetical protein